MKRLVIHPGLGKVGSTSIQSTILNNQQALDTMGWQGIALPQEMPEQSGLLMECYREHLLPEESYIGRTRNTDNAMAANERTRIIGRIASRLHALKKDNVFLSSEYFLDLHPDRRVKRLQILRELIEPFQDSHQIEFLVYFRRQDLFVESLYQQFFKPDYSVSFPKFLDGFRLFNTDQQRIYLTLDYRNFIDDIVNEFPSASINPIMLELLTNRGEELCKHAFSYLDVDLKRIEFALERKNRGCSGEAIFLINHWHDQGVTVSPEVANYVRESGVRCSEPGYRLFSSEQRQLLCDTYFDTNVEVFGPEGNDRHVFRAQDSGVTSARENVESCLPRLTYEKVSRSLGYKSFRLKTHFAKQVDGIRSKLKRNR